MWGRTCLHNGGNSEGIPNLLTWNGSSVEVALVRTLQWYRLKFLFPLNLLKNAEALKRVQRTTKQGALIGWTNIKGSVSKAFSHQRWEWGNTILSLAATPWKCAGRYRKKTFQSSRQKAYSAYRNQNQLNQVFQIRIYLNFDVLRLKVP